ncbi:hypothetical protein R1sor_011322 [Riccia sorocarpa]|uniref:Uncharacterized protein n=1 Tax=Riccia sorocarpa TaxID=122646 RepID=A0ABD3I1X5_9MARC
MVDEDDLPEQLKLTGWDSKKPDEGRKDPPALIRKQPATQPAQRKSTRGRRVTLQVSDTDESYESPNPPAKKKSKPDTAGSSDEEVRQQFQMRTRQLADVINRPVLVPAPQNEPDEDMDADPTPADPSTDPMPIDLTNELGIQNLSTKGSGHQTPPSDQEEISSANRPAIDYLDDAKFNERFSNTVEGEGAALNTTTEEMQVANEVLNMPGIPYQPAGHASDLSLIDYTTQMVEMAEQLAPEIRSLKEKYIIPVMDLHPTPTQLIDALDERVLFTRQEVAQAQAKEKEATEARQRLEKELAKTRSAEEKWKAQVEAEAADRRRLREEHGLMLVTPENPTLELLMQWMVEREQEVDSKRATAEINAADLQDQLDSARFVQTGVEAKATERKRWERNAARLADFMKQSDELRKALREKDVVVLRSVLEAK